MGRAEMVRTGRTRTRRKEVYFYFFFLRLDAGIESEKNEKIIIFLTPK